MRPSRFAITAALLLVVAGVATAGIQQMLLAANNPAYTATAQLPASSATLVGVGPGGSTGVGIALGTDGSIVVGAATSGGLPDSTWLLTGVPSDFEIQLSGSGDAMAPIEDAVNTWLSLYVPRHWGYAAGDVNNPNPGSFSGTLTIRRAAGHAVLATMTVSMYSEEI